MLWSAMAVPALMVRLFKFSVGRRARHGRRQLGRPPLRSVRDFALVAAVLGFALAALPAKAQVPPAVLGLVLAASSVDAGMNIDGGRSDLPGMKQDMFDRVQKNKQDPKKTAKVPDCPKSDKMSPWYSLAFANQEVYVRLNGTDGECERLITVGGANYTELINASKTCGPAGEWKKRIAEELSAVFFQGGFEWVKSENETIEVVTDTGTYQIEVNEHKHEVMLDCWARACDCEQAKNPMMRMVFYAMLVVALSGFGFDAGKLAIDKVWGKKPSKHVLCKKDHRMEEVKHCPRNYCDICGVAGTIYQCSCNCNYDLCKACYKTSKKKLKDELAAWLAKHPQDPDNKKEKKDKKKKGSDDEAEDEEKSEKSNEDGEKSGAESGTEADKSEKTSQSEATGDE